MLNVAIIGANYGDEGKGRSVDYWTKEFYHRNLNPLVVRFSGSNNAAHTVETDEKRAVFNLLGSGTLRGAPTYLYKHVYIDPMALLNEYNSHRRLTELFVDPRCKIVLPYDVILGRVKEFNRGKNKHGSTGNGLNEAVNRNEFFNISMGNIENSLETLELIREKFEFDIGLLDISCMDPNELYFIDFLKSKESPKIIYDKLMAVTKEFRIEIPYISGYDCILEGSQGLALDEYNGNYPHVTRARTGSHNIVDFCREFDVTIDDVFYVTRPYLTRHGADSTFVEADKALFEESFKVIDNTNVPNKYQDHMKYAFLDLEEMKNRIFKDIEILQKVNPHIAPKVIMTCIDQIDLVNTKYDIGYFAKYLHHNFKDYLMFESPINDKAPK